MARQQDSAQVGDGSGKGLVLPGLIVGLLTGLAIYGVVEYWIDDMDDKPLAITVLGSSQRFLHPIYCWQNGANLPRRQSVPCSSPVF